MSEEYDQEVIEQLKRSKEQQGYLEKAKRDQHGNLLAGRHRKQADPNWPEEIVEVKDDLDRELKIIHYNIQRRPTKEETAQRLLKIAKLLVSKGVPNSEVLPNMSKIVPYSERWLRELLPNEYKQQYIKTETTPSQDIRQQTPKECANCGVRTWFAKEYEGAWLCGRCFDEAQANPEKFKQEQKHRVEQRIKAMPQVKVWKPTDKWEQRKAQMQVPVSHMEQRLAERLTEAGVEFESQVEYCIGKCVADFRIKGIPFFVDYEKLHLKREEKDDEARQRLAQFYHVEPVGLSYEADTKEEEDKLFNQIVEKIKEVS